MTKPFQLDVVSPESTVWSGEATFVVARTPEGELGILADHEPLMGALVTGPVIVEEESGTRTTIGVHGGFIQVFHNQVTLITDRAEIAEGGKEEAKEVAQRLAEAEEEAVAEADEVSSSEEPDSDEDGSPTA